LILVQQAVFQLYVEREMVHKVYRYESVTVTGKV